MQKIKTDLTGKRFDKLVVLNFHDRNADKRTRWLCQCDCGNKVIKISRNLLESPAFKSCGCTGIKYASKKLELAGMKFGVLLVLEFSHTYKKSTYWKCLCDCGSVVISKGSALKIGKTKGHKCSLTRGLPGDTTTKNRVLTSYKVHAKKRKLAWLLTDEEAIILFEKNCFYCDAKPSNISKVISGKTPFIYNGIDRIDNTKNYSLDNVVSCCYTCNKAKGKMPYQEFMDWIDRLIKNQSKVKAAKNSS